MPTTRVHSTAAQLLADTAGLTGEPFFAAMAKSMAHHLGTRWAIIGELASSQAVHVVAACDGSQLLGPITYDLPGSPCEQTVEHEYCTFPQDVTKLFPDDKLLADMGAVSYCGAAIHSADGQPLGLLAVLHDAPKSDIAEHVPLLELFAMRVGAELERKRMERQLLRTQKLESLGVLAGGIAHDFNNLLVGILGNLEMASSAELPPEVRTLLADAARSSQAASELTQQLLAYSGRHESQRQAFSIESHARDTVRMLAHLSQDGTDLPMKIEPDLPMVHGDAPQIRQVVMNMITNANEAMHDKAGRPTIRISHAAPNLPDYKRCSFRASTFDSSAPHVAICVADQGDGMDAETLRLAFDPFFTTKESGRGLGLSAVLGILRNHDGAILIDSQLGKGTSMTVFLPVAPTLPRTAATSPPADIAQGKRVLVVDDNDIVRLTLVRALERMGCDVAAVADGSSALAQVAADQPFDAMIIDKVMPTMSGPELIASLRDQGVTTPILLTTGFHQNDDVPAEQVSGVLSKPWTRDELRAGLQQALAKS